MTQTRVVQPTLPRPYKMPTTRRRDPWSAALLRLIRRLGTGTLRLTTPDGVCHPIAAPIGRDAPPAELILLRPAAARRLLLGGPVGFAQAYMDGDWWSPDLPQLLDLAARNADHLRWSRWGSAVLRWSDRLRHCLRPNSRRGSRRNIAFHYDLGNAFYRRWLDAGMQYSSALFATPDQTLEEAQADKLRLVADWLAVAPGARVLEIGCGWGALAEHLAQAHGCAVTGITLSVEQLRWTEARLAADRAAGRVEMRLQDYRDTTDQFDAVVSIEMIEAVGEARWPRYFQTLRQRLRPGGVAVIQAITIDDARFPAYRQGCDFIQRHIFPGGMMPCPQAIRRQAAAVGLRVDRVRMFGESYARTLAHWRARFFAAWPTPDSGPFDARFHRMWDYYLAYCEAGFRAGHINVGLWRLSRSDGGPPHGDLSQGGPIP